ncbi:RNA degradosome polyphosphate kinase [Arsenicicoccus sp. MKL-02]|uniref:Multifunctional fusion protein n=4 Tax=Arsenicicoccus TaxID=267408 RepID=A0A6I3IBG9_9MICO|nr:RNA degradosome polyphosphate kinase [Arsenicicoccus cauae]
MCPMSVESRTELSPHEVQAVAEVVGAATQTDGVGPLSEQARLDLTRPGHHVLALADGEVVGYAGGPPHALELVVAPAARGRGVGGELLDAVLPEDGRDVQVWAHGDLPAARALLRSRGLAATRDLRKLGRPLEPRDDERSPVAVPDGFAVRTYRPGDEAAVLAVNAAAFAHHPEQGSLDLTGLQERMASRWFEPEGLILVEDVAGEHPRLAAFHWTKVDPEDAGPGTGEVYVVGVDPAYQGRGLGALVTRLGLDHLRDRGLEQVVLYVEADNAPAMATYTRQGFTTVSTDVQYSRRPSGECDDVAMQADDVTASTTTAEAAQASPASPSSPASPPEPSPAADPNRTTAARPRSSDGRFVRVAADAQEPTDELPDDRFLDRELSWLQFNERVLQLAADPDVPLLERARFLAIFASNLDEFFMVRVAGLKRRIATGLAIRSASGLEPDELQDEISRVAHELMLRAHGLLRDQVEPELESNGIRIVRWHELTADEQTHLSAVYRSEIFPVLTPLAVDPAHPFPYISGLSLNLAVTLTNPRTQAEHFARIKVPDLLPRLHQVSASGEVDLYHVRFVPLEDIIAAHLDLLFPGMQVQQHFLFRVTRNEDLEVEEDDAENLLKALEKELTRRRFGPPVRLEVEEGMDAHVLELLVRELGVEQHEVYRLPNPLDLRSLNTVADLQRTSLHYPAFRARTHPDLAPRERSEASDVFGAIRRKDILLHHPYNSFSTSVQAFLEQAAADPKVLAIKQTLYRTSGDSPIIDALIAAAEAGKQVVAVVEIKARFDESNNIAWARRLEHYGVHVVYGIVGLKTHAKLSLVVRQEPDGLRRYCHVGTGNYNPKTARLYEDLGVLTCDAQVGEDLTRLFNQLSGWAPRSKFKRLLVAPRSLRSGLIELIEHEAELARAGRPARVALKANSIVDEAIIDALYRASQAGVQVDVLVRGICALRPGVPGLSDTIRVRSILGRFLEHSRIFVFGNDGDPAVYIGSADMMHRNLDRRVESLVRITRPEHVKQLEELMEQGMADTTSSWHLQDDRWVRHHRDADGQPLLDHQAALIEMHLKQRRKRTRV